MYTAYGPGFLSTINYFAIKRNSNVPVRWLLPTALSPEPSNNLLHAFVCSTFGLTCMVWWILPIVVPPCSTNSRSSMFSALSKRKLYMSCDMEVKSKFIITKFLSFHSFLSFTVGSFSSSLPRLHLHVSIMLMLHVSKNDKKSEIGK